MAWDTEGTRRRIGEAAAAEFAERGPDGTTVAQIAARAGVNKERLYNYFGDKRALFHSVLGDELDKLAAGVAATRTSASSPGGPSTTTPTTRSWPGCCSGRAWRAVRPRTRSSGPS